MLRLYILTYCVLLMVVDLKSQPPTNQWYSFGRTQSGFGTVVSTDSCYYASGVAASTTLPMVWDAVFARIAFDGTVEMQSFLHNDTVSTRTYGYTTLEATHDHNFVTLAEYGKYFLFIKYAPNGDTIYTKLLNDFYDLDSNDSVWPSTIIELEDSTFMCLGMLASEEIDETYFVQFHLSKEGDLIGYNLYPMNLPAYWTMYPGGMTKTDYGYLITGNPVKPSGGDVLNHDYNYRYIKTDNDGNLIEVFTDYEHVWEIDPRGILFTYDGGYLHGGSTAQYNDALYALEFEAQIVKLNPDFSRQWVIKIGIPTNVNMILCTSIKELDSSTFVAAGYCFADTSMVGWLVKFNIEGELIWDSYFSYVAPTDPGNFPEHEIQDLQITPDNGFVMVGRAWDKVLTMTGAPGSFAWLIKTDSVGCLVPGCQDFFGVDEIEKSPIILSLYPNPTSTILNIYYNDPTFNGNEIIQIFDLQGKLIREWKVTMNDITFMYDVTLLESGTYILKVLDQESTKIVEKFVVE